MLPKKSELPKIWGGGAAAPPPPQPPRPVRLWPDGCANAKQTQGEKKALNYILVQLLAYIQLRTLLIYTVISGCPSIVPRASTGVIYSPNFPWNYPNLQSCEWNIAAAWRESINLTFTKFNLEPSYGSCDDYVEIRDKYGYLKGKYCGSSIPPSITSYGSIRVRFYSDSFTSRSGFMAFYQKEYSFPTTAPYWTEYPYTRPHTYYWTTKAPVYSPSAQSIYACRPYTQTSMLPIFNNDFVYAYSKYKYAKLCSQFY